MRIREEQVRQITASMDGQYRQKLATFFRETIPEVTSRFDDALLLNLIAQGLQKARAYGIETGQSIIQFIGLMIVIDPDFDDAPNVRHYLTMPDLDPDYKIRFLSDRVILNLRRASTSIG